MSIELGVSAEHCWVCPQITLKTKDQISLFCTDQLYYLFIKKKTNTLFILQGIIVVIEGIHIELRISVLSHTYV